MADGKWCHILSGDNSSLCVVVGVMSSFFLTQKGSVLLCGLHILLCIFVLVLSLVRSCGGVLRQNYHRSYLFSRRISKLFSAKSRGMCKSKLNAQLHRRENAEFYNIAHEIRYSNLVLHNLFFFFFLFVNLPRNRNITGGVEKRVSCLKNSSRRKVYKLFATGRVFE